MRLRVRLFSGVDGAADEFGENMRWKVSLLVGTLCAVFAALSATAGATTPALTVDSPSAEETHLSFPLTISGTVDPTLDWSADEVDGLRFFIDVVPWFATGPIEFDENGDWSVTVTHEMMDNPDGLYNFDEILLDIGGMYGDGQFVGVTRDYKLAPEHDELKAAKKEIIARLKVLNS